jgi:hypothetical protein
VAPEEKGMVRCDSGKDGKAILVLVTVDKPKPSGVSPVTVGSVSS